MDAPSVLLIVREAWDGEILFAFLLIVGFSEGCKRRIYFRFGWVKDLSLFVC